MDFGLDLSIYWYNRKNSLIQQLQEAYSKFQDIHNYVPCTLYARMLALLTVYIVALQFQTFSSIVVRASYIQFFVEQPSIGSFIRPMRLKSLKSESGL